MGSVTLPVVFNSGLFLARYPEFTAAYNASPTKFSQAYFYEAGLYLSNGCGPVKDPTQLLVLLNMLVAHISFLAGDLNADGQARPVGRVSAAGEGSVNATFEMNPATPGTGPWFMQTQYGAAFWQATSKYRGFRYFARPTCIR